MAISYIASSAIASVSAAASITISKPTGTADNDIMIALLSIGSLPTITAPAGWTQIANSPQDSSTLLRVAVYYKIASGEGASYQFDFSPNATARGLIRTYRGEDTGTPLDATPTGNNGSDASAPVDAIANTLTTVTDNAMLLVLVGIRGTGSSFTDPSGFGNVVSDVNQPAIYAADKTITPAGATGNQTVQLNGTTGRWGAFQVAIRPAAVAGGNPWYAYAQQ